MSLYDRLILFLKGMAMGISDLIPGISGGTIALLLGIYKEFISSLKSINQLTLVFLINLNFKKLNEQLNLKFIFPVFIGILISIFIFSKLITYMISNHKILLLSFFYGLILFSSIRLIRNSSPKSIYDFLYIVFGFIIGLLIMFLEPLSTSHSFFSIFFSGFIAISAMLLPGISGSYILLILGKYKFMLDSISSLNFSNISIFSLGAILGILSFSKIIHWLIINYYRATIFFLSGLMLGTLNKVWPWQLNQELVFPYGDESDLMLSFFIFIFSGFISNYLTTK